MRFDSIAGAMALVLLCGCDDGHDGHDHSQETTTSSGHETTGPHGGELVELGDHMAHLEVLHDEEAGTITMYALSADLSPTELASAPVLNLIVVGGPKQIEATGGGPSAEWVFSDPVLKGEPEGARLRVVLDGVTYTPDLPHHHSGH